jgi:hypothetical protein
MGHMIPPLPPKQKYKRESKYGVSREIVEAELINNVLV